MNVKNARWFVLAGVLGACLVYGQDGPTAFKGKQVPAFSLKTFEGKPISNASLKGKPYILDFWATWCGPCKAASPTMQKLHEKFKARGLVVIGANVGERDGGKKAKGYPKEHKYTYTFVSNADALGGKLKVSGIPAFVFVDKTGKIAEVFTGFGPGSEAKFEAAAKSLL